MPPPKKRNVANKKNAKKAIFSNNNLSKKTRTHTHTQLYTCNHAISFIHIF